MRYDVTSELSLPERANRRYSDLSVSEVRSRGYRVIGGDLGDLTFSGFDVQDDKTVLCSPVLRTGMEDLTEDDVTNIATDILMASYASVGIECIEHS